MDSNEGFRGILLKNICSVLSHLSRDDAEDVTEFLLSKGVKKLQDVKHITVNILSEKLNFVESSELYSEWQKEFGTSAQPGSSGEAGETRRPLSTIQRNAQKVLQSKLPVFDENSPYFPSGVKAAIKAKERPSQADRESMVERIVDHCRETVPNLQRSMLNDVALQIVKDFGCSFKDTIMVSEHGSDSLATQLKVKFDNDNRGKKRPKTPVEKEAPAMKEAFGCIQWDPSLPEGESEESLEKIRVDLKKTYRLSSKDWDWRVIKKKLQESYYLQRKLINSNAVVTQPRKGNKKRRDDGENNDETADDFRTIPDVKDKWPFLFTTHGMNIHFKQLTDVDLKTCISTFVAKEGNQLIDFLSTKGEALAKLKRRMVRAEEQRHGFVPFNILGRTQLTWLDSLSSLKSSILFFPQKTKTYEEMRQFSELPEEKTPVLVAAGNY
ncbi:Glucose-1-phosphate adenylyltransferase large subunit 2, chloroplastic/amyloplastic [Frankliniella fusca]|uniref:Glucose-1-phosphate adenylyltransferase large subunit 2, chloroplastic/amyloplastic n=1 Tax=Frankliniella fusca TaxID=407009 RepID=A0AAE1LHV9_9NEOP|nr:Glucose-1-phosphate adenylyltransferase large subunit 2, chloroplastic/amyloplastic [Frankliniella fusca]